MTEIVKIENHTEEALDRRLSQWVDKPNMEKVLTIESGRYQELEDVFFDLLNKRMDLAETEGQQLDNYGTIVGQERMQFDDEFYRVLLTARIGINVSNGEAERIISTLKLLTKAQYIHFMNLNNLEIAVGSDGVINPLTVEFLISNLQRVVMGGVRVNYLCMYSPDEAFSMDGPNAKTIGKGFGTVADVSVGGKFGQLYTIKRKFSFSGNNTSDNGFGTLADPLVGGVLSSL